MKNRFRMAWLAMIAVLLVGGCTATEPALTRLDQVILLDIHPLFGGTDLWIGGDGKGYVRTVAPPAVGAGMEEKRYAFTLSGTDVADLRALLSQHRFFEIATATRSGDPDEARPNIYLKADGRSRVVGKWANEQHPDFDPVYARLRALADAAQDTEPVWSGPAVTEWTPDGFPSRIIIAEMAGR